MSALPPDVLACPTCDSTDTEAIVQGGSYAIRCVACKTVIVATSWMAVGPEWRERVRVYRDGDEGAGPVLEGIGCEIWERIGELAMDGTTIVLRPVE